MTAPPPALLRWFSSTYPTLKIESNWIEGCLDYLTENFPDTTPQKLIKLVESQLLLSDLSQSTTNSPSLFPSAIPQGTINLFPTKQKSILVQIIEITEIGQPALHLLEVLKEKREIIVRMNIKNEGVEVEEDDGEEKEKEGTFGRGMLKFKLSDGFRELNAIEYKRIDELRLGQTKLGSKLILQNVKLSKGTLMLTPESVVVKGHSVEEFEVDSENLLEKSLKIRLGMEVGVQDPIPNRPPPPISPPPQPRPQPQPQRQQKQQQRPPQPQPQQVKEEFDEFEEDDDFNMTFEDDELAFIEAEKEAEIKIKQRKASCAGGGLNGREVEIVKKPTIISKSTSSNSSSSNKEQKFERQYVDVDSDEEEELKPDLSEWGFIKSERTKSRLTKANVKAKVVETIELSDSSEEEQERVVKSKR